MQLIIPSRSTFKVYLFGKDNLIRIKVSELLLHVVRKQYCKILQYCKFLFGGGVEKTLWGCKKFSGDAQPLYPPPRKSVHGYSTHVYIHTKYLPILKQLHVSWRLNLRSLFKSHLSKSFRMQCS